MASINVEKLDRILLSKKYYLFFCILKGFRNGVVYGTKVRLPHALINSLLYRSVPAKEYIKDIYRATFQHASSLATYVATFKFLQAVFSKLSLAPSLAASLAGFLIFGVDNKIHEQINLYLLSRVIYSSIKLGAHKGLVPNLGRPITNRLFAAIVWGLSVWLFLNFPEFLHRSLFFSMKFLYSDSNKWEGVNDFIFGS